MKIIFDSEEQMDMFCERLGHQYCPNDLGFGGTTDNTTDCERCGLCKDCWKDCGIEMEVKDAD